MNDDVISEITEDSWRREVFPEWGTWLNEHIESTVVPSGHLGLWWIANMGIWIKTSAATHLAIDLWCGTGKRTHHIAPTKDRHQWHRVLGVRQPQPNLRAQPMTLNPFAIHQLDALLVTHFHHDHIDKAVAAAVLHNVDKQIPFIGPQAVANQWEAWGVPQDRIHVVHPGDEVVVGDTTITALESFDRTALVTDPVGLPIPADDVIPDMGERAVNYLISTDAGNVYHGGDSHYSTRLAQHGDNYDIDIAFLAYGENPIAVQDKMTSSDILRAAEALQTKKVIPIHWDAWTNTLADPQEVLWLWKYRKDRFHYQFTPYSWLPGGYIDWPEVKDDLSYFYDRGFADRFSEEPNLPYPEMF